MKIGTLDINGNITDYYYENEKYYEISDSKKTEICKFDIAEQAYSAWNIDCISDNIEKTHEYICTKVIPIYDWITLFFYGYGKTEKESIKNTSELYLNLISYYNEYKKNKERNKIEFMKKIHKFAYCLNQDSKLFNEIYYFEDNNKDFRENIVKLGMADDARADEPIFGYVYNNNIIIFKLYFSEGEKELFYKFVEENYEKIAKYYNLNNYNVYLGIKEPYEFCENEGIFDESFMTKDFDYYQPRMLYAKY